MRRIRWSAVPLGMAGLLLFAAVVLLGRETVSDPFHSVEYGIASLSPSGEAGGYIIPASCGSPHAGDECTPPTVTAGGSSSSSTIVAGSPATIEWTGPAGVSSCDGTDFSTGGAVSGSATVNPSVTTTYTVNCSNGGSASVTVTVVNPTLMLTATPPRIQNGHTTMLDWSTTFTLSCTLFGGGASWTGTSGSVTSPIITQPTTFTLNCTTAGGPVSTHIIVNLLPAYNEI